MNTYDVAVVGAGPAGSVTAAGLAGLGYRACLLDRSVFPREKPCAEYCSPGVGEVLRRQGVWQEVAPVTTSLSGMKLFHDDTEVLPISYRRSGVPASAFTVPRFRLDSILVAHAARRGVDVREGCRLTALERGSGGFRIRAQTKQGNETVISARVVVGADGLHSATARFLGIRSRSSWPRRLGLVSYYEVAPRRVAWGEMHVGTRVYCGLAPVEPGVLSVGLVVELSEARRRGVHGEFPDWALDRLPGIRRALDGGRRIKPLRGVGPMTRHVDRVAGSGFLLVGDAAGFLDPLTGEGLFRAIRGAEIAVEVIDAALARARTEDAVDLSTYTTKRKAALEAKTRLTWLIQLALSRPGMFHALSQEINRSSALRGRFGNVLGDIAGASTLARLDSARAVAIGSGRAALYTAAAP